MKVIIFAAFLAVASTAGIAQNATSTGAAHYNHSQVNAMTRTAKTPAQFLALRDYYNHRAETDRARAAEAKLEWDRRSANPMAYARKYPAPVDSAHYLYESYTQSAEASASEARHYEQLVSASGSSN